MDLSTIDPRRRARGSLRVGAVFALALGARLLYIWQIRRSPYFDVPLIDGPNYFRTAAAIAGGSLAGGHQVFWQPPLYPYFLALLFVTVGTKMMAIYCVQAAVGSLSCVLTYLIGRRVFGERAACASALIMAFYGPLIHFDAQPLIPVLHIVLTLAGLLMLLRARPAARDYAGAGLLWGLSGIATPNILLTVPPAALWVRGRSGRAGRCVAGFLIGVAVPIVAVTARNVLVAREAVLISSNGGINFYIGNNPDYEKTIRLRPGGEFERLAQEPEDLGIVSAAARSRYFAGRALEFLRRNPGAALRLYARKTRDLVAGREIPRNQDQYGYRSLSALLALLLWRFGVSFPFGVVAPLALAGALARPGGQEPAPTSGGDRGGRVLLLLYAASYAVSVLLFFPTDRYRLPLVPVAALYAGRFLAGLPVCLRRPRVLLALGLGLILFNLDALRASESYPEEEALNRAYALRTKGRPEEARDAYLQAMALNPRRIDPYNALAAMAAEQENRGEEARRLEELLRIDPGFADVHRTLGEAYLSLGRVDDARREWQTAVRLAPGQGLALADLCLSYYNEDALALAEPFCERALAARPDLPEPHFVAGLVARSSGRRERARAEFAEAARLFPPDSPAGKRVGLILERMRRRDARERAGPAPP